MPTFALSLEPAERSKSGSVRLSSFDRLRTDGIDKLTMNGETANTFICPPDYAFDTPDVI